MTPCRQPSYLPSHFWGSPPQVQSREPRASLGSRRNRLQNAGARPRCLRTPPVFRPAPAAQTPAPPCSASGPAIEMQLRSLRSPDSARPSPRPAAGSQAAGRTAPHPPERWGPAAAIPRVPVVPSLSRCIGSYGRVLGTLSC